MQLYVATFPEAVGPVDEIQLVEPPVPEIDQFKVPVGVAEPVAPVTVAVNVIVPPRVGEPEAMTRIVGVYAETVVEVRDATFDTALYAPSPP